MRYSPLFLTKSIKLPADLSIKKSASTHSGGSHISPSLSCRYLSPGRFCTLSLYAMPIKDKLYKVFLSLNRFRQMVKYAPVFAHKPEDIFHRFMRITGKHKIKILFHLLDIVLIGHIIPLRYLVWLTSLNGIHGPPAFPVTGKRNSRDLTAGFTA